MARPLDTDPFASLLEISAALAAVDTRQALARVLEILREALGAASGAITLADGETGALRIEASFGFTSAAEGIQYRPGEGLTGMVYQSGKAIVVPKISEEPLFLNRSRVQGRRARGELSFFCLPIFLDGKPAGTLALAVPYRQDRAFQRETAILHLAAAMTGLAVKVARLTAADRQRLLEENRTLRNELQERYEIRNLIGNSHVMRQVYEQVAQASPASTTVLIRGESGTGKELVARAIHYASPRSEKPFVKVSCGALPETLIESELFGVEPGAFTDARSRRPGRFELAHGGTLFLDEIGELSPSTQVKLLRVLQEREFERLGGVTAVKVDVRVVAATHRNLEAAIQDGTFREDLYYRLNVFDVFLPPLRDRSTDILLLADHFVEKFSVAQGKDVRRISNSAIDMLMAYHWPGNVRELENCIERAVLVCEGGVIHAHHLPPTLQTAEASGTFLGSSLEEAVGSFERDLIQDALKSARGNRARAARLLQTTERILNYKTRKYGIAPERFKA
ncbi:sigma-54-dependent Fis family transcriptional regulator [Mesoterricola silvestris]|uniref:Sigma-54-dependent Fis family transcriptional regulator n=1 Tax=Mesoterricola silvestris TaxID=2927979 RepID=A0AA48GYN7_9BACT|nr:sigma 54-interacting transcriptional regulator [Mesoterricola silvestris]BDU74296.1 sigma-54-dependent Fis family transcriptional regulator [Mesoterricola silvestris]